MALMRTLLVLLIALPLAAQIPSWNLEWDFHEGSGSTVHDISGHSHDGTVVLANLPGPRWIKGNGLDFSNVNQVPQNGGQTTSITIPTLHYTGGTLSISIMYSGTIQEGTGCNSYNPWIISAFDPSNNGWGVATCQAGTGPAEIFNGTNFAVATINEFNLSTSTAYPAGSNGAFHIRTISLTGGQATFTLDGVTDPGGPVSIAGSIADNNVVVRVGGKSAGGNFFNGEIAHLAVCVCALTAGNVTSINSAWAAQLTAVNPFLPEPTITYPLGSPVPSNGNGKIPAMGWQNWYGFSKAPTEANMIPQCQALAGRFLTAGYNICQAVELQYEGVGANFGDTTFHADLSSDFISHTFPLGTKHWCDSVHGIPGILCGVYSSAGKMDCGGGLGSEGREAGFGYWLSTSGVDAIEQDGCYLGPSNPNVTSPQLGLQYWQDLLTGNKSLAYQAIYGNLWGNASTAIAQVGHTFLFQTFTGSDWAPDGNQCPTGNNSARVDTDVYTWSIIQNVIASQLNTWAQYALPGCWQDLDSMDLGTRTDFDSGFADQLTAPQQRTNISLWSLWRSPLFVSNDLTAFTNAQLAISNNSEVITVDQDNLFAQGQRYQSTTCGAGKCEVYATKRSGEDTWFMVMYNGDTGSQTFTMTLANITGASGSYTNCRDVWSHSKPTGTTATAPGYGSITTSFGATIAPGDVVALRCSNVALPTPNSI